MIDKLISGGQTGVDRAALDLALELHIPCGGWCPKGRLAEDGPIAEKYPLVETPTAKYPQRTEWNVRDSDGTLVITQGTPDKGTALTIGMARKWRKPCLSIEVDSTKANDVRTWIAEQGIRVLNVAGPRESSKPGIYDKAKKLLTDVFSEPSGSPRRSGRRG